MRLLNLGCGSHRHGEPWTNLDCLRETLAVGTPERTNLDTEPNYVEHRLGSGPLPFEENTFDGILCSHVIEHFDCHEAVGILKECHRALKTGGVLVVSVPNASVFREHIHEDTPENAERLFGEPIYLGDGEPTFMGYALFNRYHKQVLTEDSLWCLLARAGFVSSIRHWDRFPSSPKLDSESIYRQLIVHLNRLKFSLVMVGIK